jgi:hypothetical protein
VDDPLNEPDSLDQTDAEAALDSSDTVIYGQSRIARGCSHSIERGNAKQYAASGFKRRRLITPNSHQWQVRNSSSQLSETRRQIIPEREIAANSAQLSETRRQPIPQRDIAESSAQLSETRKQPIPQRDIAESSAQLSETRRQPLPQRDIAENSKGLSEPQVLPPHLLITSWTGILSPLKSYIEKMAILGLKTLSGFVMRLAIGWHSRFPDYSMSANRDARPLNKTDILLGVIAPTYLVVTTHMLSPERRNQLGCRMAKEHKLARDVD